MAIDPFSIGIGLLGTGIEYFNAQSRKEKAEQGLAELEKNPYKDFLSGETIYNRATQLATGLTQQEIANEQQGYNRLANQRYRLATNKNPSLSGAIQAGINYGGVQNTLGLASMDAQVRRQNLNQLLGLIGNQANRQTQSVQNQMSEYGGAIRDQNYNQAGTINNLANTAFTYSLYNPLFGKQQTPPTIG